mgnify:CR=1 FL=1
MKFKKVKEIECRIYCNPSLLLSEEFAKQIKKINEKCGGDFVIPGENVMFILTVLIKYITIYAM